MALCNAVSGREKNEGEKGHYYEETDANTFHRSNDVLERRQRVTFSGTGPGSRWQSSTTQLLFLSFFSVVLLFLFTNMTFGRRRKKKGEANLWAISLIWWKGVRAQLYDDAVDKMKIDWPANWVRRWRRPACGRSLVRRCNCLCNDEAIRRSSTCWHCESRVERPPWLDTCLRLMRRPPVTYWLINNSSNHGLPKAVSFLLSSFFRLPFPIISSWIGSRVSAGEARKEGGVACEASDVGPSRVVLWYHMLHPTSNLPPTPHLIDRQLTDTVHAEWTGHVSRRPIDPHVPDATPCPQRMHVVISRLLGYLTSEIKAFQSAKPLREFLPF